MSEIKNKVIQRAVKQLVFIAVLYGILAILMATGLIDRYTAKILTTASIYVIVSIGLNLVTGMTGQLVLGHAGFMAVGAYVAAILLKSGWPAIAALFVAAVLSAVLGFFIGLPALRLRGDYLAIVTLGFGEIIRVVLMNLDKLTGGAAGMKNVPGIQVVFGDYTTVFFLWVSIFMVFSILAVVHLLTSSHGRAILSVRDDEIASESMGINTYYTKVYAFVLSTFLAGIAGGLFAMHYGYLSPDSFNLLKSMDFLIIAVFGGLGSLTGTVLSSFVVVLLQEELRFLQSYRLVIYPLLLILMMIFRPQGLLGTKELKLTSTLLSRKWWKAEWPGIRARLGSKFSGKRKGGNGDGHS
jgi:branched-chain amino acid transport system permease protein